MNRKVKEILNVEEYIALSKVMGNYNLSDDLIDCVILSIKEEIEKQKTTLRATEKKIWELNNVLTHLQEKVDDPLLEAIKQVDDLRISKMESEDK